MVSALMPYLARDDLYLREKPYGADFPVEHFPGSQLANHLFDYQKVAFHDVRTTAPLRLDIHGSQFIKAETCLTAEEATNETTPPIKKYLADIETILHRNFPQYKRVEVMDFQVRKRSPNFPNRIGAKVEFAQPAAMPHTDFSVKGAWMRMEEAFPNQKIYYESRRFDLLNVWKPLVGPNDDWPLAVCDFNTVDFENDVSLNDALHQKRTGENWLLQSNPAHKWYYMSAQDVNDLLVFRNTDSAGTCSRGFHAAFPNPRANCQPRQSIEVRVVGFLD